MTSKNLVTAPVGIDLAHSKALLHEHRIEKLLVVDEQGLLKGLITIKDIEKAIIASGFSEGKRVRKAQELGAGTYVKKPYTIDKIAQALQDELKN